MTCHRCGRCCLYFPVWDWEKQIFSDVQKRCKYLIGRVGIFTACRIYPNRIGTKVDDHVVCVDVFRCQYPRNT